MTDATASARILRYLERYTTFPAPGFEVPQRTKQSTDKRALHDRTARHAIAGALLAAAVVAALVVVLIFGFGLRAHTQQPQVPSVSALLTAGPRASEAPGSSQRFVWLTGDIVGPPATSPLPSGYKVVPDGHVLGQHVEVVDWTGKVRYQFDLPSPRLIEAISSDGTRALLRDGTVLNELGATVATIVGLASVPDVPFWASGDSGVCIASESVRGVTLTVRRLDGRIDQIASWSDPNRALPLLRDEVQVLACDPQADTAVVVRYAVPSPLLHPCVESPSPATPGCVAHEVTPTTASLWAVRMSTGAVLLHVPDSRLADVIPSFAASEDGSLAVESLWATVPEEHNELSTVIHVPSGDSVPIIDGAHYTVGTIGISADGTRTLRQLRNPANTETTLELVNSSDGRILRSVTLPGDYDPTVVAEPDSASFMIDVSGQLALIDASGGISVIAHPGFSLGPPDGVDIPPPGL